MKKNLSTSEFARALLHWHETENTREMPWKGVKDPYRIWLSEIILQQTRVDQGLKYYEKFISRYPSIQALAAAPETEVFKLWEGLGYYSRCRNLMESARYISHVLHGKFPDEYNSILKLRGVGTYTASAIASFAYNLPYAVVDGNVFRVLSRICLVDIPVDSAEGKKKIAELASQLIPHHAAAQFNQAIMDFGATVCKPSPECNSCFYTGKCGAYLTGKQDLLPFKKGKVKQRKRWMIYVIVKCGEQILVRQRTGKDIWQQLHEFLLIECPSEAGEKEIRSILKEDFALNARKLKILGKVSQKLTHQHIHFSFYELKLDKPVVVRGYEWMDKGFILQLAFPKALQQFAYSSINDEHV